MYPVTMQRGDPAEMARELVSEIPLEEICRDEKLMNAFLAELFLAISKASTRERDRQRQAAGIAKAKAQGVRFGHKAMALPDNFDEVRLAWRRGEFSIKQAAELCGMAKSTFHDAVQRVEGGSRA